MADIQDTTMVEETVVEQPSANDEAGRYDGLESDHDDAESLAQYDDELQSEIAEEDVRNVAAEVAQKYVRPGGIVSVYKSVEEQRQAQDRANAQDYIAWVDTDEASKAKERDACADKVSSIHASIHSLTDNIRAIEDEQQQMERVPEFEERRLQLLKEELMMNEEDCAESEMELFHKSQAHARAEAEQHKYAGMKEVIQQKVEEDAAEGAAITDMLHSRAVHQQQQQHRKQVKAAKQREQQQQQREQVEQKAAVQAEAGQSAAQHRMREATSKQKATFEDVKKQKKVIHGKRAEATMVLKRNTEIAASKIQAGNIAKKKKEKKVALIDERRRLEVLAQGGNPYAVKGLREQREQFAADQQKVALQREERYDQIAGRLMTEQAYLAAKEEEQARIEAYEKAAVANLSRDVVEARRAEYLKNTTRSGQVLIDPTSKKSRVDPSKETLVRTAKFGLGLETDEAIMENVRQQLKKNPVIGVAPGAYHTSIRVGVDEEEIEASPRHLLVKAPREKAPPEELAQTTVTADDLPQQPHAAPELKGLWEKEEKKRQIGDGSNLSKYEQRMMTEAHERHKTSMFKDQVVWGKVYDGPGFICDPPVLRFIDFKPGTVYKRKVVITNVSYTFNYFKLGELEDTMKNFFDVTFTPPGRMSAGLTCDVWITFEPKLPEDIHCEVPFLAETGPFELKIECTLPKLELYFNPEETFDLGTVEMDQSITKNLIVTNRGYQSTQFSIHPIEGNCVSDNGVPYDAFESGIVSFEQTGEIKAATVHRDNLGNVIDHYVNGRDPSITKVPFTFRPNCGGNVDVLVEIRFENDYPSFQLQLVAVGKLVPIYLEIPSMAHRPHLMQTDDVLMDHRNIPIPRIDLECCTVDHFYRDLVVLQNRSNSALKCQFSVPKQLQDLIELHPDMCYVQGNSQFSVQLKCTPTPTTLQQARDAGLIVGDVTENETFLVKVPVSVLVPDRQPVKFCVSTLITQPTIRLSHTEIDFGLCSVAEAVKFPITVTNMSSLPQEVAFVKLPHELRVDPLHGFVSLNPYPDSFTFDVLFQPTTAKQYKLNLQLQSKLNHTYNVTCHGKGLFAPLQFATPVVKFAALAQNQLISHAVMLKNGTKKPQTFEFGIPADWPIKVHPSRGVLPAEGSCQIRVDFVAETSVDEAEKKPPPVAGGAAQQEPDDDAAAADTDAAADDAQDDTAADEEDEEVDDEEAADEEVAGIQSAAEPRKQSDRWETFTAPCFIKDYPDKCIYLEVQTCVFPSLLEVECSGIDAYGSLALQFGELALKQVKFQKLRLKNLHPTEQCDVKIGCTLPHGPFSIQAAPRLIAPGGFIDIPVRFEPRFAMRFMETLDIFSNLANVKVCLRGDGVIPSLRLEPDYLQKETEPGKPVVFDVGDTLAGECLVTSFAVVNASDKFELEYSIGRNITVHPNHSSRVPFDCIPNQATVPREGKQQVNVSFMPDHESWRFRETILVAIAGQTPKPIAVEGRAWKRSLFLRGCDVPTDEVDDPFMDELDEEAMMSRSAIVTLGSNGAEREIIVGNIESKDKNKKNEKGDIDIVVPADAARMGFVVEPTKLSVNSGDVNSKIKISFNPQVEQEGLLRGEWLELDIVCNMKGGYTPPDTPPGGFTYNLKLRGLVT